MQIPMKIFRMLLMIALYIFLSSDFSRARAEGPITTGADTNFVGGGVDRVVETVPNGYIGVAEKVQISGYYPTVNTNDDSAASYLGCLQGQVVAEGGIVWYSGDPAKHNGSRGWGAFLNIGGSQKINNGQNYAWYWNGTAYAAWRGPGTTAIYNVSLNVEPNTGSVYLYVDTLGYFYAVTDANHRPVADLNLANAKANTANIASPFDIAQLQQCQVKRVIAMNRADGVTSDPFWDDNSQMYAAVSNIIYTQLNATGGTQTQPWKYQDGTGSIVTQETPLPHTSGTGYDSFANSSHKSKDLLDVNGFPTANSKYRVNFPYTSCGFPSLIANQNVARDQGPASWNATDANYTNLSRYTQEYVEIWLRKGAYTAPRPARPRRRLPH